LIQQFIIPYFNFVFLPSALAYETVNPALEMPALYLGYLGTNGQGKSNWCAIFQF